MSAETLQHLNTQVLVGFTDKRGNAWHYREDLQGVEPNHYPGAIPVEDVHRRLFSFQVQPQPIYYRVPAELDDLDMAGIDDEGNPFKWVEVPDKRAQVTDDTRDVLGIFSTGYLGHQYPEWLVRNVENLLDDDLGIGSAGLLRGRARAWVSVEVPENVITPEGVEFRPHLVAATSFDGSLSTTYKRTVTAVVCDNTLSMGLAEKGQQVKVRHSRYSDLKLQGARDALAIVHTLAEDFTREVALLCAWKVTDVQFHKHLDLMFPLPDETGRGRTIAEGKRDKVSSLYRHDVRAATWQGTAFGVLQAHNTYAHHFATIKGYSGGVGRSLRNQENALNGRTAALDAEVIDKLQSVCS